MRMIFFLISCSFFLTSFNLQCQENTLHLKVISSLTDIQDLIQFSEKPLLIYYTAEKNCTPCMRMKKEVFSQTAVIEFYEMNFTLIEIQQTEEMTKVWKEQLDLIYTPTFLFYNEGRIVHKYIGFLPAEQFINLGKVALEKERFRFF